jgi:hypothetical protein
MAKVAVSQKHSSLDKSKTTTITQLIQMKKIFKLRAIAIVVLIMFISVGGQSQITWDDNAQQQDAMVPLDGGLSLLLGAGAVYGIRKLRKKN